ncbi:hypothetical protein GGI07_004669 [Coemansia sp. Benny D115]|nr:hypothetical protein GGI07_004669 [Coemansia sp. Benny D115]
MDCISTSTAVARPARSPPSPTHPLRLSRIEVQCTDPDLKRAALSELFDHCMSPIAVTASALPQALKPRLSAPLDPEARRLRARPLSAAPLIDLGLSTNALPDLSIDLPALGHQLSGLVSPVTPSNDHGSAVFYGIDAEIEGLGSDGDDDGDDDEYGVYECVGSFRQPQELGTFADLRRRLYGGEAAERQQQQQQQQAAPVGCE